MILDIFAVVPLAGTWIEISLEASEDGSDLVVPLAGTWIEILHLLCGESIEKSFPLRERGLK